MVLLTDLREFTLNLCTGPVINGLEMVCDSGQNVCGSTVTI